MDILLEQLVYGSFPFWDRGYDVLARSSGCRAEWVAEVLAACRQFGQAPAGIRPCSSLFSVPLASGPRAIVGVEPQGDDDRGRPGALAFHALLVAPKDFRKADSNPFAFVGALRRDWSASTTLTATFCTVEPRPSRPRGEPPAPADPRTRRIAEALAGGRRVALESAWPVDALAREVWARLPERSRRRGSVATWAFGNANRFDLVALPRLAGVEFDRTYLDPAAIDLGPGPPAGAHPSHPYSRRALAGVALAGVVGLGLGWQAWRGERPSAAIPPTRPDEPASTIGAGARARIVARLADLADRLEVGGSAEPGPLMAAISGRCRYRGPTLSPDQQARLAAESDPDAERALAWHRRIAGTFADDRPLPGDFAGAPLGRQLDDLARGFHLVPSPEPEATLDALFDALSREGPIRPTPLAGRYPPLSDYARFLGKLPRRE